MPLDATAIEALIKAARAAGRAEIMPRFRNLDAGMIDAKSAVDDLVTVADTGAERMIEAAVRVALPDAAVIGEEAVADDPGLLSLIADSELAVIIDPIDGTWNFANGLATFGTILAVTQRGETILGLLYDPVLDDWVVAVKGGGAWYEKANGARVRLDCTPAQPLLSGLMPVNMFPDPTRRRLLAALPAFDRFSSLKCSCHEYRILAQGNIGFCVGGSLKPWDHAAGALIVREAGGEVGLMDGQAYDATVFDGVLLSAANADVFGKAREVLAPVFA